MAVIIGYSSDKDFSRFSNVPETIKQKLRDKFGEDISFHQNMYFIQDSMEGSFRPITSSDGIYIDIDSVDTNVNNITLSQEDIEQLQRELTDISII